MKIVIIGPAYPLRGGGMATFNERLARQFLAEGHQTTIYTFSLQYPSFLFPGSSQYSIEAAPTDLNIKVCINSINPFNWLKIGNLLKNEKPDLIVVRYWLPFMGPCFGTILRIAKKNKHSKVVCIADNVIPHEKRWGDKIFTKYFIKPVDAFITMSEKVLQDLQQFTTTKKATLVPHPLYDNFGKAISQKEAKQKLNIAQQLKIVLFFGFIRKYKGLDILFDAIKILKDQQKINNIKFLIAGEFYEDEKKYHQQIAQLNIADHLILKTNFINDSDVKYYFCAADVVIQPYRNATQSGVTPLAYHFEKPMIVTNVGGLPSMVPNRKSGLVAEPNAADIAAKLDEFFRLNENYFLPFLLEEKKKLSWESFTAAIFTMISQH
jgi:glycosyltransferase involved in cell wall biosynthesis